MNLLTRNKTKVIKQRIPYFCLVKRLKYMSQDNQSVTLLRSFKQKGLGDWLIILVKRPVFVFFAFLSLTLCIYLPTIGAGFVTDVTSGIERIQGQPFRNVLYSFGFPALNQISVLGFYVLYTAFGLNGWVWYLIFCSLHAFNAFLNFSLFRRFFEQFNIKQATNISFIGALLFLMNPYQTEVLVWRACLNYLLVTAFVLLSLHNLLRYLATEKRLYFYALQGFFLLALFTFELSLILPLLAIVFYTSWLWVANQQHRFLHFFMKISLPQFILMGGYFLLNKWIIGSWIGHYGATTHLKFSLTTMSDTLLKYGIKYLFFVRSYPHQWKQQIFNFCDDYSVGLLGLIVIFSLFFLVYKKQGNQKNTVIYLSLGTAFGLALLPVLNLYFYWIQAIENDRYGYLPSVFGLMLLTFFLFQLPKFLRYILLTIYFMISLSLLIQTNQTWKESTTVFYSLLEDYRWQDAENVVILNVPDNYQGAYMFRIIGRKSGFQDALTTIHQQKIKGKIWEVAQYNMTRPTDGVQILKKTPNQLKVTFNQWGNWFWRNGIGAGPTHQRSIYTAHFKGQYYLLDLKNPPANTVYIYQDGKEWKELE